MEQKGFIMLYRSIQNNWIYPNHRKFTEFEAWLDLLLLANHTANKVKIDRTLIVVERGQHLTSMQKLGARWLWTKTETYNFARMLQRDGMILLKSSTKFTLITICNYDSYQAKKNAIKTPEGNEAETNEKRSGTNNNDNNENNVKNEKNIPALKDFLTYTEQQTRERFKGLEKSLTLKYQSWVESGWKDGNGMAIKNWKSKILNVIPYLKEEVVKSKYDDLSV